MGPSPESVKQKNEPSEKKRLDKFEKEVIVG
jgi:hypothetical protein